MDWIQGERFIDLANNVNIFYRHTHDVNYFFKNLPTKEPFVLISHNSDGCIMGNPDRADHADIGLVPGNLIHWFGQNVNTISPYVSSIPLGLENDRWLKKEPKLRLMREVLQMKHEGRNLLYINHNIRTNPEEREKPVSYTHLRAHETVLDLVCRLLLAKKKQTTNKKGELK